MSHFFFTALCSISLSQYCKHCILFNKTELILKLLLTSLTNIVITVIKFFTSTKCCLELLKVVSQILQIKIYYLYYNLNILNTIGKKMYVFTMHNSKIKNVHCFVRLLPLYPDLPSFTSITPTSSHIHLPQLPLLLLSTCSNIHLPLVLLQLSPKTSTIH